MFAEGWWYVAEVIRSGLFIIFMILLVVEYFYRKRGD